MTCCHTIAPENENNPDYESECLASIGLEEKETARKA